MSKGGHDIPRPVQERRFGRSFANAVRAVRVADATVFVHSREEQFQSVGMARHGVMAWRADIPGLGWLDRITQAMGQLRPGDDPKCGEA